jgi:hypothetical protein
MIFHPIPLSASCLIPIIYHVSSLSATVNKETLPEMKGQQGQIKDGEMGPAIE